MLYLTSKWIISWCNMNINLNALIDGWIFISTIFMYRIPDFFCWSKRTNKNFLAGIKTVSCRSILAASFTSFTEKVRIRNYKTILVFAENKFQNPYQLRNYKE